MIDVSLERGKCAALFGQIEHGSGIALGNAGRYRSRFGHVHPFEFERPPTSRKVRALVRVLETYAAPEIGAVLAEQSRPRNLQAVVN